MNSTQKLGKAMKKVSGSKGKLKAFGQKKTIKQPKFPPKK